MDKTYAIIGRGGTVDSTVIANGLKEVLTEESTVTIPWAGPSMTQNEGDLFDYLLDFEVPTTIIYEEGDTVHPLLRDVETVTLRKSRDKVAAAAADAETGVLLMWGDDNETVTLMEAVEESRGSTQFLELTNGLEPITLLPADQAVIPESPDVPMDEGEDDYDSTSFTRDELESMTAAAVKRYGARLGMVQTTKGAIINKLFPEQDLPTVDVVSENDGAPELPEPDENGNPPEEIRQEVADAVMSQGVQEALALAGLHEEERREATYPPSIEMDPEGAVDAALAPLRALLLEIIDRG